jgi:hypothetical protein
MQGISGWHHESIMQRKHFLRAAVAGTASALLAPLLSACGGGGTDVPDNLATGGSAAPGGAAPTGVPPVTSAAPPIATAPAPDATPTPTPTTAPATDPVTAPAVEPAPVAGLTAEEVAGMRYMREEEKLAHDVYRALYARWGAQVFDNIADSETEHTEAVLARLVAHGIADPAAGRAAGDFENPELQALYDRLVAAGGASLVAALSVGALIEERDIQDIRDRMAATDEADVRATYQNLLCGSYNHLQAFNRQLVSRGVSYATQVIPQSQWDAIVAGTALCTAPA